MCLHGHYVTVTVILGDLKLKNKFTTNKISYIDHIGVTRLQIFLLNNNDNVSLIFVSFQFRIFTHKSNIKELFNYPFFQLSEIRKRTTLVNKSGEKIS